GFRFQKRSSAPTKAQPLHGHARCTQRLRSSSQDAADGPNIWRGDLRVHRGTSSALDGSVYRAIRRPAGVEPPLAGQRFPLLFPPSRSRVRNARARVVRLASARVKAGVRTGGCLCGAVRYSVRGDPVHVGRCHCTDCRKESGSAFSVYGQWPVEAFEMSGKIASYDGRGFCPRCGSRLLDTADPDDTLIEIRIGSLDDAPFELKPEAEIWVKRRESWIPPVEGAAQHDEN